MFDPGRVAVKFLPAGEKQRTSLGRKAALEGTQGLPYQGHIHFKACKNPAMPKDAQMDECILYAHISMYVYIYMYMSMYMYM